MSNVPLVAVIRPVLPEALLLAATNTTEKVPAKRVAVTVVNVTDPEPGPVASLRLAYQRLGADTNWPMPE